MDDDKLRQLGRKVVKAVKAVGYEIGARRIELSRDRDQRTYYFDDVPQHPALPAKSVTAAQWKKVKRALVAILGKASCPLDNRLMADVETVEVADCVNGAFQSLRRRRRIGGEHEAACHGVLRSLEFMRLGREPRSPG